MVYPVINYKPRLSGETDQPLEKQLVDLCRLESSGYMRVVHHGGEKGYHIKLVLNEKESVSLFVWNEKVFRGENTYARSYGVIPIEEIEVDEEEGDELVAEGKYELKDCTLTLYFDSVYKDIEYRAVVRYKLLLKRVKEYISPKHGHSARPEYLLLALPET